MTDTKRPNSIAIIGGGNLGASIAEGLQKSGYFPAQNITVTRRKPHLLADIAKTGILTSGDNLEAVKKADWVLLAVKPYQIRKILEEIKPALDPQKQVLVSVATGVSLSDIQTVMGTEIPLFRAMPNTAISIQQSMTCVSTNNTTETLQQAMVEMFDHLGRTVVIDEGLMAAATVLGACGIAFSLRFIRAASQGGIEIGFNSEISQLIAAQTVKGAASLLLEGGLHPEREIDKVTTPQGCTIAGLNEMEHQGFSSSLIKGVVTSFKKIDHIAEEF